MRNVLVLRGGALGDFVLTLPALTTIRQNMPGADIKLCTRPRHAFLALSSGLADRVSDIDSAALVPAFSPQGPLPPDLLAYFGGFDLIVNYLADDDRVFCGNLRQSGAKRIIAIPPRPAIPGEHAADFWRRALAELGWNIQEPLVPRLRMPDVVLAAGKQLLRSVCGNVPAVVIHPGSGSRRKNWPLDSFLQIADLLQKQYGLQPVFLRGEAEFHLPANATAPWPAVEAGLPEVTGILSACRLYIGNDSGITHLAAIMGASIVALFGPTDPVVWGPRGPRVKIIRSPAPDGDMSAIKVDDVFASAASRPQ